MEDNQIAEIQVSYTSGNSSTVKACSSFISYQIFLDNWNEDTIELQEECKVLLLNRANRVLGIYNLSKGGCSSTIVDPKLLFSVALKTNASAIILAHNHPSGNLSPSDKDILLTRKLMGAGELLDLAVLDHLIITKEGYYSFSDEGQLLR